MNWMGKASMTVGLALGLSSVAWAQTAAETELLFNGVYTLWE